MSGVGGGGGSGDGGGNVVRGAWLREWGGREGLDWIGLEIDWIGLDWTGLDWIGLDWTRSSGGVDPWPLLRVSVAETTLALGWGGGDFWSGSLTEQQEQGGNEHPTTTQVMSTANSQYIYI